MGFFTMMLLFLGFFSGGFRVNFEQISCFNFFFLLLSALNMVPRMRGVFRNQSNIYDVAFYKNSKGFQLFSIFAKSSIPDV